MRSRLIAPLVVVAFAGGPGFAGDAYQLAPFKDELFAYPRILDSQYDGDYLEVEYSRPRDLHARDAERGIKVKPRYVSLDTAAVQTEMELKAGAATVKYVGVGKTAGDAKAIVLFVHGRGTGYKTGVDDWIHGGNFNRIKNLMMRNDGAYLSSGFADFGARGTAQIRALMLHHAGLSPGAPVFLACASSGGNICWRLLRDRETAPLIAGLLFIDASLDKGYLKTASTLPPSERIPIHISSSREDTVVGWRAQRQFFRDMKAAAPDYPIRYVLFSAGTHGLSLRMTDWRTTLNWMLGVGRD